jgi:hypothetical protein
VIIIVVTMIVFMLGYICWRSWNDITSPVIRLRKDQWGCSASHTTFPPSGGKWGARPTRPLVICDQYTRGAPNLQGALPH